MRYITKKDNEELLKQYKIHSPVYLTLGFNNYVKFGLDTHKTKERMKKNHKHFFNELHRQVYKKSKKKIPRYVVIERGGKTSGFHSHIVIEKPEHLSTSKFVKLAEGSWIKTKDGVSFYAEDGVNDRKGLDGYNAKQQSQKNTYAEVDLMNSYTNKSLSIS